MACERYNSEMIDNSESRHECVPNPVLIFFTVLFMILKRAERSIVVKANPEILIIFIGWRSKIVILRNPCF